MFQNVMGKAAQCLESQGGKVGRSVIAPAETIQPTFHKLSKVARCMYITGVTGSRCSLLRIVDIFLVGMSWYRPQQGITTVIR